MGNLILCKSPVAAHPYYVAALGIRLYTAEELGYYIYNNIMLIERNFIDEKLLNFIRETGFEELALKLEKWKEEADFWELLLVILQDIHYYSGQELEKFRQEAGRIATEGYETIAHERADYMLSIGRYYDALRMYGKILEMRGEYISNKKTCAKIHEGIGVAYARLFVYDRALGAFEKAYSYSKSEKYLKHIYMLHLISPKISYNQSLFEGLEPGKLSVWAAEFEAAKEQAKLYGKAKESNELADKDERKRRAGYLDLISAWRDEYRRCMG